ncbi:MAG: type II toxin-antitoxin system RelB/DinJ family antitoxin [Verrucomicrobia bacterium]|nr:type II toxin-antitoxin system RelB/DinJ family antitoxin [Verrucomicrobiota bacterium]
MKKSAVVHARLEPQIKKRAEGIFAKLGMSSTEAIRLFYTQVSLHKGLPFTVKIPNKQTQKVLKESQAGKNIEQFDSLDDMYASWDK